VEENSKIVIRKDPDALHNTLLLVLTQTNQRIQQVKVFQELADVAKALRDDQPMDAKAVSWHRSRPPGQLTMRLRGRTTTTCALDPEDFANAPGRDDIDDRHQFTTPGNWPIRGQNAPEDLLA
jgi:hypothetical protein